MLWRTPVSGAAFLNYESIHGGCESMIQPYIRPPRPQPGHELAQFPALDLQAEVTHTQHEHVERHMRMPL